MSVYEPLIYCYVQSKQLIVRTVYHQLLHVTGT